MGVKRTKRTYEVWIWKFIALIFNIEKNYEVLPKIRHFNGFWRLFKVHSISLIISALTRQIYLSNSFLDFLTPMAALLA